VIGGAFRETHHAAVLENWGLLWMWHSLKAFLQCTATALLAGLGVGHRWPYLLIWVVGLLIWCAIFWSLRKRGGPVLFVERVIAHVWGAAVIGTVGVFFVEMLMGLPVLTLSPVLALIGGMVFTVKGGLLSGEFYFHAAALYLTAVLMVPLMAWYPPAGVMLFGVAIALCFFQPGLKYYRQQARAGRGVTT
jgi:serine/threonine-protein kinase